jgi:purine catabolism regulator
MRRPARTDSATRFARPPLSACNGLNQAAPVEQTPPTVHEVLAFPEVQRGHPVVVAGRDGLDREVSWVHVLELSTVSGLLRGGELVLLTGVALPDSNDGLRDWVRELAATGASAALIQLGERWTKLPPALVRAAERAGLPLVGLHTVVPFVDITRAVLTSIVHSSFAETQQSAQVHELFHRIALEGRSDAEVIAAVSWLTGASAVLESRNHQVLAFHPRADRDSEAVLHDWERRSRRDGVGEGWVISEVRARGQTWGRVIAQLGPDAPAGKLARLAVQRGAENIALRRVIDGAGAMFELEARSELLDQLLRGRYRYEAEGRARAEAAGFPMSGRTVLAISVQAPGAPAEQIQLAVARAAAGVGLEALMGLDSAGLVSVAADRDPTDVLARLAGRLRRDIGSVVVGVGERVAALGTIHGALLDATSAARAEVAAGSTRPVVGLRDVRVRGLLAQLAEDPRLQAFVERELGPLLADDKATELDALRAYLVEGRNKSAAAHAVGVSRPAFYARLRRAAGLLGADLDDPATCLSLQLALLGHQVSTVDTTAGPVEHRPLVSPVELADPALPAVTGPGLAGPAPTPSAPTPSAPTPSALSRPAGTPG